MRRYFSRMQKEKGSGRVLGVDPIFRDGLCFFIIIFHFLLAFYFRILILILYTIDFNPRINKDIIIIWASDVIKNPIRFKPCQPQNAGK